ncbi:Spt20p [Sporobolomyces salmoneus]|uniref:Spt20p n=1 Tax=Sporobolomyces salmoneus TaxID=183962 RepID=UPI00316D616B
MASGATYNITRYTRQVLKRYRRSPPSVVVHLYPNHFRFEHQHGNFSYDSPMKCFLESIREQKLPTDLLDVLDSSLIPYYDGCLIVEVHDHRHYSPSSSSTSNSLANSHNQQLSLSLATLPPSKLFTFSINPSLKPNSSYNQQAEVYRIVLAPNPATLWTELGILSNKLEMEEGGGRGGLSEDQAVQMEAVILNRTVPPLCLDPSIQTSRIANSMLRATTLRPPKRKRFCNSGECDDGDDAEEEEEAEEENEGIPSEEMMSKKERDSYEKLMKTGDEGIAKLQGPAFSRLAFIQSYRERQSNPHASSAPQQPSSLKAQPGSAITSIRLGSSQAAAQRGASPAVSVSSQRTKNRSHAAGGDMSDGATSTTSTNLGGGGGGVKKAKKVLDAQGLEKKQMRMAQKKKEKERKRLAELEASGQAAGDAGGTQQAKFTWSGSPQ